MNATINAIFNEFAGHLYGFVSFYIAYRFVRMLMINGMKWKYTMFAISGIMIFLDIGIQREWAAVTRFLATEGLEFNRFMNEYRGLVNVITGVFFTIGVALHERELLDGQTKTSQARVYSFIVALAALITWGSYAWPKA